MSRLGLRKRLIVNKRLAFQAGLGFGGPTQSFAPGAAASFDFQNDNFTGGSLASMLSVTQPATTFAWDASGNLVSFALNTPRITSKGFLRETTAATNVLAGSNSLSNASFWSTGNFTVTPGAPDPLGGTNAFTLNEGAANVAHRMDSAAGVGGSITSGNFYCVSAIVKAGTGAKLQLSFATAAFSASLAANFNFSGDGTQVLGTNAGTIAGMGCEGLGNGWFLIWYIQPATATVTTGGGATIAGTNSLTNIRVQAYTGASKTVIVYHAQIEQVAGLTSRPSSMIQTTAAGITRAADVVTLSGAAATALGGATGSLLIQDTDGQASIAETIINANGTALLAKTAANLLTSALTTPISSVNAGTWSLKSKAFLSWSPSGRNLVLNDNVPVTDATAVTPSGPFTILGNGYIGKMAIWGTVVADSLVTLPFEGPLTCWGDSLTNGGLDFASPQFFYPTALANRNAFNSANQRVASNQGVSGNTSTQILTRFNAAPSVWNQGSVIWSGRNDIPTFQTTVLPNIATMVSKLLTNQFVVLSVTNEANGLEDPGSTTNNNILTLNAALAATYGNHYIDVWDPLIAGFNPAIPADVIDHSFSRIPYSLRATYGNGAVTGATINPGDTAFTVSNTFSALAQGWIVQLGTELIQVLSVSSGTTVTNCVRGYAGTTPGTYAVGTTYLGTDPLHIGPPGNEIVASAVAAGIAAIGDF